MPRRTWLLVALAACGSTEPPPPPCEPGSPGPVWLTEGETVQVPIACAGEAALTGAELAMNELPAGAVYDPVAAVLRWTPGLDQAAVWQLEVEVVATGETGEVTIGVADAYDHPENVPVVDPEAYPLEHGVPVLFIDPGPSQSDVEEPVQITYQGRTIAALGEKRGASSLSYPKNSYLLKFESEQQFYDLDRDFVARRRIVLTSTFDDNAYLRQRLVFELWNALEPSLPIEAYSVVVYLGGDYWGLYTLTDHPSKHWLESLGRSENGSLYKAFNHDANFRATDDGGAPKATLHQGYEKKLGAADDFADIDALVDFVASSGDADFRDGIADLVELDDYTKWLFLVVFTHATDSAGKNSYHYSDGGTFVVAPWDFNASFGQAWETSRLPASDVQMFEQRNELFRRLLADAELGPATRAALAEAITDGPFSIEALDNRVDSLIAELDASARRDWRKWAPAYGEFSRWAQRQDMTDYEGELAYVLAWIEARRGHVLSALE